MKRIRLTAILLTACLCLATLTACPKSSGNDEPTEPTAPTEQPTQPTEAPTEQPTAPPTDEKIILTPIKRAESVSAEKYVLETSHDTLVNEFLKCTFPIIYWDTFTFEQPSDLSSMYLFWFAWNASDENWAIKDEWKDEQMNTHVPTKSVIAELDKYFDDYRYMPAWNDWYDADEAAMVLRPSGIVNDLVDHYDLLTVTAVSDDTVRVMFKAVTASAETEDFNVIIHARTAENGIKFQRLIHTYVSPV